MSISSIIAGTSLVIVTRPSTAGPKAALLNGASTVLGTVCGLLGSFGPALRSRKRRRSISLGCLMITTIWGG